MLKFPIYDFARRVDDTVARAMAILRDRPDYTLHPALRTPPRGNTGPAVNLAMAKPTGPTWKTGLSAPGTSASERENPVVNRSRALKLFPDLNSSNRRRETSG